jgi:hypothetical protein
MNENYIAFKLAMESARKILKRKVSKEDALRSLIRAGILDENGNFTAPYQNLAKAVKYINR